MEIDYADSSLCVNDYELLRKGTAAVRSVLMLKPLASMRKSLQSLANICRSQTADRKPQTASAYSILETPSSSPTCPSTPAPTPAPPPPTPPTPPSPPIPSNQPTSQPPQSPPFTTFPSPPPPQQPPLPPPTPSSPRVALTSIQQSKTDVSN